MIGGLLGPDLSGAFRFHLPKNVPLGHQNLNVTCPIGGRLERPIAIDVFTMPEVTSVTSEIHSTDLVFIQGTHLEDSSVWALPTVGMGGTHDCVPVSADAQAISCQFNDITPGEYRLQVQNAGCPATVPPPLTVLAPGQNQ